MSISHTVKSIVEGLPHLVTGGVPGERAGLERLASRKLQLTGAPRIPLSSPAFAEGTAIPGRFSADGENVSPPLTWGALPGNARAWVLLVEDPDAPTPEPFVHWIASGTSTSAETLLEGAQVAVQGKNSMLGDGWTGCAPPRGDHPHHYHFQLFALDQPPTWKSGVGRAEVLESLPGHVVGFGEWIGTYTR